MRVREGSEFDEADEDVSDRLFSLDEILSESEAREVDRGRISEEERDELLKEVHESVKVISPKTGEEIDPKEVIRKYLEDEMSLKKIGEDYGFKSGKPIKRVLEAEGAEIRSVGFQEIDVDPDEVYQLYFEEGWGLREVADHFECKSTDPILRVFREQGWKTRYQETYEKEIDPEEVFRLYDEGMSIRKIGEHYGVSYGRIHREFTKHGKEYGQEIQVDPEVIRRLYFDEGLTRDEVCESLGFSRKVFDRVFSEQEWETRPAGFQPVEIDLEDFKNLYYGEELLLKEIAQHFEVSETTVSRFRKEHNLRIRDKTTIRNLRDSLFGTECAACGKPRRLIHKKDGEPHLTEILWRKKDLLSLDPNDWVALCRPCHRITHSLMRYYQCEWKEIEIALKKLASKRLS
jgi:AraC-like DNA-binding protein